MSDAVIVGSANQWHDKPIGLIPEKPAWMASGACNGLGPDLFYPDSAEATKEARAVCRRCPVTDTCLEYALDTRQTHGVWGGTSERERVRIRRRRRLDAKKAQ